ncbi:hypothetical protein DNTS_029929 [Danionella cerebrum]|uniref:Inhibitor of growth protein n=1 Tax=Danionella cerebrum TaxID=2873325 RepID=A0A553RPZ7_9TELE|nr:hypothetical protein DNTS_029929 [Danionella translucida]
MEMAKGMYLENYLDSIEGLPCELQRNFSLMQDLDSRTEEKKTEINELASEYMAKVRDLASEERVDKHIRRLDAELARFENDLQQKLESGNQESSDEKLSKKDKNMKDKKASHGRDKKGSDQDSPKQKRQKNGPNMSESLLAMHPSDVLDMPVDPNEPTYCLCSQVSYGEMIGCDNSDCPIEWFHFACVGLTTKPKGKWYCPRCTQDMRMK